MSSCVSPWSQRSPMELLGMHGRDSRHTADRGRACRLASPRLTPGSWVTLGTAVGSLHGHPHWLRLCKWRPTACRLSFSGGAAPTPHQTPHQQQTTGA